MGLNKRNKFGMGVLAPLPRFIFFCVVSLASTFFTYNWLGLKLKQNSSHLARSNRLATSKGMLVTKVVPNSPSDRIGISAGDIIRQVNQDRVDTQEGYNKSIADLNNPDRIMLLVQRGRQGYYVTLEP